MEAPARCGIPLVEACPDILIPNGNSGRNPTRGIGFLSPGAGASTRRYFPRSIINLSPAHASPHTRVLFPTTNFGRGLRMCGRLAGSERRAANVAVLMFNQEHAGELGVRALGLKFVARPRRPVSSAPY